MASINKLSIRGIRAFSPDDEEQVISFCFPLTIIVGANGCGKTTIIESLRYAVTGQMPPGVRSGQAFVHDPRSAGQTSVKANIKLRFTNRASHSMVVIRSMEVTQKRTTLTFKALDGILRTTNPDTGERISMSHKCTELDRQIPTLMGVSKPILEHVVFCHQEESSWPLMEGAVLKKRFDDIFDSTRYAKALEAIRKCRLERSSDAKELKADLAGLASHRHAATQYRAELEETSEKMQALQQEMQDYQDKMKAEQETMDQYAHVLAQVEELKDKQAEKRTEIQREQHLVENTRRMLERDMTSEHSLEELKKMRLTFDTTMEKDQQLLEEKVQLREGLLQAVAASREEVSRCNATMGRLSSEKERHEGNLAARMKKVDQIAQEYDLDLTRYGTSTTTAAAAAAAGAASGVAYGAGSIRGDGTATTTAMGGGVIVRATESQSVSSVHLTATSTEQESIVMTEQDVALFTGALYDKERTMKRDLEDVKKRHQREEDEFQLGLSDLNAKMKSIENERQRISNEQINARQEIQTLSSQYSLSNNTSSQRSTTSQYTRVRKSDVDEAKRTAATAIRDREELSQNPRLQSIPKTIKQREAQMDALQRLVEDGQEALVQLRKCAEEHSAIGMLESQVAQDVERLGEVLEEHGFVIQKYHLPQAKAEDLTSLEVLAEATREKGEKVRDELRVASVEETTRQRRVTEKSTLLEHMKRSVQQNKSRLAALNEEGRGFKQIERVVADVRRFETERQGASVVTAEVHPQKLQDHLGDMLKEYSTEDDQPASVSRTITKLSKMSVKKDESGMEIGIICPCCCREMDPDETAVFKSKMIELADPDRSEIVQTDRFRARERRSLSERYETWKSIVAAGTNDWLDHNRIRRELEETEASVERAKEEVASLKRELQEASAKVSEQKVELDEVNVLLAEATRLRDDGTRINDKRMQIKSRKDRLALMAPSSEGRSLQQVEADLMAKQEEKDRMGKEINSLNREMSTLNNRISLASTHASAAEKNAREKEAAYARQQEATQRRNALSESIAQFAEEDKKLQEQIAPLRQQILAKNGDKERMRSTAKDKEDKLSSSLASFGNHLRSLEALTNTITKYIQSNKAEELDQLKTLLEEMESKTKEKQAEAKAMDPEIEALKKQVNEQERHKKIIEDNMGLLKSLERVHELEEQLADLTEEAEAIEGYDVAQEGYEAAVKKKKQYNEARARCEGRRAGLKDQLRSVKRKLQTQEYKDIDERHRIKMIEYETTLIAVSDLDKYHGALDKALMRYHSMKISDINKIIRELWTLTYKGEDIYNIELVSGQDSGSRASRSYNYRVVMTKGNTQMDMRGRCSAGQRVLASIVIRLALAETFCLNCGVMALDEPTTNLDYENKKGLAIALAQIISARSAQHNFQLVVITHDEDFVAIMKNELSAQAGFQMPEKFFQVSREEGQDGKYYSKIHAVDWDEI